MGGPRAADEALMDDDPRKIAELVRISRHTTHVLWQNIVFAIGVKTVFLALTFAGISSLWLAPSPARAGPSHLDRSRAGAR